MNCDAFLRMASPVVLRITRSDADSHDSYILVHVSSAGPGPLDVRLVATEGSHPYVGYGKDGSTCLQLVSSADLLAKQSRLEKLRAKNYQGDGDEWEAILSATLSQKILDGDSRKAVENLEVVASVTEGREVSVLFRKNFGGVTVSRPHGLSSPADLRLARSSKSWAASRSSTMRTRRLNCLTGLALPVSGLQSWRPRWRL